MLTFLPYSPLGRVLLPTLLPRFRRGMEVAVSCLANAVPAGQCVGIGLGIGVVELCILPAFTLLGLMLHFKSEA
jgi:hypothetical protein